MMQGYLSAEDEAFFRAHFEITDERGPFTYEQWRWLHRLWLCKEITARLYDAGERSARGTRDDA